MRVIKRNGSIENFDCRKIASAIKKAFDACQKTYDEDIIDFLVIKVTADFNPKIKDDCISIEDVQDSVEAVLVKGDYADVAKAYILYRKQREKARNAKSTLLDYKDIVNKYLNVTDWTVKENSTVTYSLGGLILNNSGAMTANYWLSEVYDDEIAKAHKDASIHIHDLSMLSGYCFTSDTRIKTPDGKNPSFKELVDNNIKNLWVFAYDEKNKRIVTAQAIAPRVTRSVNKLVKVILDTGETITCTEDHPFMTRSGKFVAASQLTPDTKLMANYLHGGNSSSAQSVEIINLDAPVDVYDITVPEYENFALDAGVFVHNCAGWSLKQLIMEGLGGVTGRITSAPAKHLSTLCNQMVNFLGIMQNEWAG